MRIDLHTHSTASDGTDSPSQVVDLAVGAGLDVIALTDHDSAAGWDEARLRAEQVELTVILGMEISTKHAGAGVHLLAYLLDPSYPPLDDELGLILEGRAGRLAAMVGQLRAAGLDITEAEVLRQVGSSPAIGRPHIADTLVAKHIVRDRAEAFDTWLNVGKPGYVNRYATSTVDMIGLVTQAGGVCVIAHPWGRGSRRVLDADTLEQLTFSGLVGIEVDHQGHSAADRAALAALAADLGLVATGSSDFHGDGKTNHELGCNLTRPDQFERLIGAAAANAAASERPVPTVVNAARLRGAGR